jgi:hypothetical protein
MEENRQLKNVVISTQFDLKQMTKRAHHHGDQTKIDDPKHQHIPPLPSTSTATRSSSVSSRSRKLKTKR